MKNRFTKENDELVLRIPLLQDNYDAADEFVGRVPNLIGVIAGNEYSISHLIALGYKDDIQEGSLVIMFDTEEELREACTLFGLDIWVHPVCEYCKRAIRGSFGFGEKGEMCHSCELDNNK